MNSSSLHTRVFIDETPTIPFPVAAKVDELPPPGAKQPEWPVALGLAAGKAWMTFRRFWSRRSPSAKAWMVVAASTFVVFALGGLASVGQHPSATASTTASSPTWYSDLGPTGLSTSETTYYRGHTFHMPAPSGLRQSQFVSGADDGSGTLLIGLGICESVRYGEVSYGSAKDVLTNSGVGQSAAELLIRTAMLDLCPA